MTDTSIEPPRIYATFRFRDAARMIDFLVKAFGFEVHARYDGPDGGVGHAELALGSSMIMCGEAADDAFGAIVGQPGEPAGKSLYIAIDDIDALFDRATKAGATIEQGLTDRDYGSREFICRDPEGNIWTFGTYWPKAGEKPQG